MESMAPVPAAARGLAYVGVFLIKLEYKKEGKKSDQVSCLLRGAKLMWVRLCSSCETQSGSPEREGGGAVGGAHKLNTSYYKHKFKL